MLFDLLAGLLTTAVIDGVVTVPMMERQLFQTHQTVNRVLPRDCYRLDADGHMAANQLFTFWNHRPPRAGRWIEGLCRVSY